MSLHIFAASLASLLLFRFLGGLAHHNWSKAVNAPVEQVLLVTQVQVVDRTVAKTVEIIQVTVY